MDKLRQALDNVTKQLGRMKLTHRLLIACVAVTLGLLLWVIYQSSKKPATLELYPGADPAEQKQFASHLAASGFKYEWKGGQVAVAPADVIAARAAVAESGLLPDDKAVLFRNILLKQSWTNSREQNEKLYNEALQNELELTIAGFKGIRKADVFIDVPPPIGLGQGARRPTAAVSVVTRSGEALSQSAVDAIASLVAGSRAGLTIDAVRVVDSTGQQRRARKDDDALSSTHLEHSTRVERLTQEKVLELLSYIPGVVVVATAQVDVTRVTSQTNEHLGLGQGTVSLPSKEEVTENDSSEGAPHPAAIPGVQSNQSADIASLGSTGSRSTTTSSTTLTENENHVGTKTQTIVDPRGFPTMIGVSVNVPRGFVTRLVKSTQNAGKPESQGGADAPEPDDRAILDAFEQRVKPTIIESIKPQVRALLMQSARGLKPDAVEQMVAQAVSVSLMPLDPMMPEAQSAGLLGSIGVGGGGGSMSGIVDKAVLGLLALVAMGMMFVLVKKSSKHEKLPTAEEVVGLPPPIDGGSEVIGEAEESEAAMTGIEVGDEQMESQKMLEQVETMVTQAPETAAKLINRWVEREE